MGYNNDRNFNSFKENINIIKKYGYNLIGVSQIYFYDVYLFKTDEEAKKAFNELEIEKNLISGFWYDEKEFNEEKNHYEKEYNTKVKIYYL